MNRRERILASVAAICVVLWFGVPAFQSLFVTPIQDSQTRLSDVMDEFTASTNQIRRVKQAQQALQRARVRSLPNTPVDAQRYYQEWLTDLALEAGFDTPRVAPSIHVPKRGIYTGVHVTLESSGTLAQLSHFLHEFHRVDLLHRIVSLTLTAPSPKAGQQLTIRMTAEGLCLGDAESRSSLVPLATLQEPLTLDSSEQTLQVQDANMFPTGNGFHVRLGDQHLQVIRRRGDQWTVAADDSRGEPTQHEAGTALELVLQNPAYAERTPASWQKLVALAPFAKPAADVAAKPEERRRPPVQRGPDRVAATYLRASILEDGEPLAWLYCETDSRRIELRENSPIEIDDLRAVVAEIRPDQILLKRGGATWRLRLGQTLASMERVGAAATDGTPPEPRETDSDAAARVGRVAPAS